MYKVECTSFGRYTQAGSLNFVREDYLIMWILEGSSFPPLAPWLVSPYRWLAHSWGKRAAETVTADCKRMETGSRV